MIVTLTVKALKGNQKKKILNYKLFLKLRELRNRNIERIFLSVDIVLNPTMPMECAKIAIMLRVELRKLSNASTQIESSMPRDSAKIAIYQSTTNAREIP